MECPNCHINVEVSEQLYGALYTCNSCKAVYFINFEGQPEFGEISEEVLSEIVSEPEPPESFSTEPIEGSSLDFTQLDNSNLPEVSAQDSVESSGFEGSLEPLIDSVDIVNFDNKLDQQFDTFPESVPAEAPIDEVPTADVPGSDFRPMDFSNPEVNPFETAVSDVAAGPPKKPSLFDDVAKEISEFGNTDVQIASLNYDLKITGLDTHEIRQLFQEVVGDSKLGWDASEIMRNIKNGQVEFVKLNPVKAYILAKRLQFLDVEKHWKQNAIS